MNRTILILAVVVTMAFSQVTFGNVKPNVAVYVVPGGKGSESILDILSSQISEAILAHGGYTLAERSADFLSQLGKEHSYERGGAVDDKQIAKLGSQFGVDLVCVVKVNQAFDSYHIASRLIDVESATVSRTGNTTSVLTKMEDLIKASKEVASALLGASSVVQQAPKEDEKVLKDSRDGKTYPIETFGYDTWMVKDLKYNSKTGGYTWKQAVDICPTGWRLPSNAEWGQLKNILGTDAGKYFPSSARWWSATEDDSINAYSWYLSSGSLTDSYRSNYYNTNSYAVRCVKD